MFFTSKCLLLKLLRRRRNDVDYRNFRNLEKCKQSLSASLVDRHTRIFIPLKFSRSQQPILDSIVVSIPACHAGDRGSIPRRGGVFFCISAFPRILYIYIYIKINLASKRVLLKAFYSLISALCSIIFDCHTSHFQTV